ncbi:Rieske (2Fe-2S) protein [Halorientalis marina]|jgi:nitrite reductase/ring-hydroxylating ferredoxin subunit|uniref:Rieske (2Fe-2S) protein n=1 Tax=Halorientalis marina TaxID=2931976 RepID=UPI001FF17C2A|nr:Rieske (2Fe-2S) protein [Halorientalis marina]
MSDYTVAKEEELDEGDRIVTEIEGREIGVFRLDGEFYAYVNWCAHQSGPPCEGKLTGTTESKFNREELEETLSYCREGEILNCPWHGWEYDIKSGECLSRDGVGLPSFPVREEEGDIIVSL